jgi:hypothetical protein
VPIVGYRCRIFATGPRLFGIDASTSSMLASMLGTVHAKSRLHE